MPFCLHFKNRIGLFVYKLLADTKINKSWYFRQLLPHRKLKWHLNAVQVLPKRRSGATLSSLPHFISSQPTALCAAEPPRYVPDCRRP